MPKRHFAFSAPLKGVTYQWNGNTDATVKIFQEGIYDITASGASGCSRKFTVHVRSQNCNLYMPNAFTPNGDGKNDLFRIPETVKITLNKFSTFTAGEIKFLIQLRETPGGTAFLKAPRANPAFTFTWLKALLIIKRYK